MATGNEERTPLGVALATADMLVIAGERGLIPDEAMPAALALARATKSAFHYFNQYGRDDLPGFYSILAQGIFQRVPDGVTLSDIPLAVSPHLAESPRRPDYYAPVQPRGRGGRSADPTITPDELMALRAWFRKAPLRARLRKAALRARLRKAPLRARLRKAPSGDSGKEEERVCAVWAEAIPRIIAGARAFLNRYSVSAEVVRGALNLRRGRPEKPFPRARELALLLALLNKVASMETLPAEAETVRRAIPHGGRDTNRKNWPAHGANIAGALAWARKEVDGRFAEDAGIAPLSPEEESKFGAQLQTVRAHAERRALEGLRIEAGALTKAIHGHIPQDNPLIASGAWDKAADGLSAREHREQAES